jgi:hypothetical protein
MVLDHLIEEKTMSAKKLEGTNKFKKYSDDVRLMLEEYNLPYAHTSLNRDDDEPEEIWDIEDPLFMPAMPADNSIVIDGEAVLNFFIKLIPWIIVIAIIIYLLYYL